MSFVSFVFAFSVTMAALVAPAFAILQSPLHSRRIVSWMVPSDQDTLSKVRILPGTTDPPKVSVGTQPSNGAATDYLSALGRASPSDQDIFCQSSIRVLLGTTGPRKMTDVPSPSGLGVPGISEPSKGASTDYLSSLNGASLSERDLYSSNGAHDTTKLTDSSPATSVESYLASLSGQGRPSSPEPPKPTHTDYLSSLSGKTTTSAIPVETHMTPTTEKSYSRDQTKQNVVSFVHAGASYFDVDRLTSKGPRTNADVGQPHDATRPLVKGAAGSTSVGSWWCAKGGWPSPNQRATTEVFYVLGGCGCVTDTDGSPHFFGPGDTVVLPKGWSGRWDVLADIHKIWVVYDHPNIEETSYPIRAVVAHYNDFAPQHLNTKGNSSPLSTASVKIYDVGPTKVGCLTCAPGSRFVKSTTNTECYHVLEGVVFLTNADGSAQRCVPGDTVVLPKGWSGRIEVIEPIKKLWVETS